MFLIVLGGSNRSFAHSGTLDGQGAGAIPAEELALETLRDSIAAAYDRQDARLVRELAGPAIRRAGEAGDRELEARLEFYLSDTLIMTGLYEEARDRLADAWMRLSDTSEGYRLGNLLGTVYQYLGDFEESLAAFMETLEKVRLAGNRRFIAGVEQNIGVIYKELGSVEEAMERYLNSLNIMEEIGDTESVVIILNNIGELYREEEEKPELALDYLWRSHDLAAESGLEDAQSRALMNLGLAYRAMDEPEEALRLLGRSLELSESVGHPSRPIQILFNRGRVLLDMGEMDRARSSFEESLELSLASGIIQGVYHNRIGLGDILVQERAWQEAMEHYRTALDLAERSGSLPLQLTPLQKLWKTAAEAGDESEALQYIIRYTELSDSIRNSEREQALARYQVLLNVRDRERTNALLEQQIEMQRRTIIGVTLAGLLLVVLLAILYRLYRRRQQLGEQLTTLNEQLAGQKAKLNELNINKDQLISVLAHDLRTPVAQLKGVVDLLRRGEDLDAQTRSMIFDEIDSQLSQGVSMLQGYLEWVQTQMEGIKPDMKPVRLAETVSEVMARMRLKAEEKGVGLECRLEDSLTVCADRQMLQVILQNLISNAIKFSHQGGVVAVLTESRNGVPGPGAGPESLCLIVRDQGIGIPESIQQQIFQDNSARRKGTGNEAGTGLGLMISREFAEKQGFQLTFNSVEGEGTDFCLKLTPQK